MDVCEGEAQSQGSVQASAIRQGCQERQRCAPGGQAEERQARCLWPVLLLVCLAVCAARPSVVLQAAEERAPQDGWEAPEDTRKEKPVEWTRVESTPVRTPAPLQPHVGGA